MNTTAIQHEEELQRIEALLDDWKEDQSGRIRLERAWLELNGMADDEEEQAA